jgi:hypothetical protein
MNKSDIAYYRLINQQIAATKHTTPKELVSWMGAMQAQDYAMVKWAVGVRLPNASEQLIEKALANGDILRTHLMRPTWHLVSSDDIYWMLELTAPKLKTQSKNRDSSMGLDEASIAKSNKLIEKALQGGKHLTRDEIMVYHSEAGLNVNDNRPAHYMMRAEYDGLVCSGATINKKSTFALLEEIVPKPQPIKREEALARLAQKYFLSHSPATLADFVWWSGLSVTEARKALESVKTKFIQEKIDDEIYIISNSFTDITETPSAFLLPAFDEYLISYKNRSAVITPQNQPRAYNNFGTFKPTIVVNGQVTGIWRKTVRNKKIQVETELFHPHSKAETEMIELATQKYERFFFEKEQKQ